MRVSAHATSLMLSAQRSTNAAHGRYLALWRVPEASLHDGRESKQHNRRQAAERTTRVTAGSRPHTHGDRLQHGRMRSSAALQMPHGS